MAKSSVIGLTKRPSLFLPGLRPAGYDTHEHQRSLTPFEGIQAGADFLVLGRTIQDAGNRREAAQRIQDDMASH
jgi:orotidine-5'-phosphate decarboxylase